MRLNKILIFLLFLSLCFGQLERFSFLPLYLHDLVIVILLLVNRHRLKLWRPVALFAGAGLFSLVLAGLRLNPNQLIFSSLYLVRFLAYSLLLNLKIKKKWLIFLSTTMAAFGLAQYLFIPDTRFLASLNWDDHYFRLISLLYDPNFTGIILVLGLILIFLQKPIRWSLISLHFLALLLTYSRSSYLALLTAALAYSLIKKNWRILLITGSLLLLTLPLLPRPAGEGVKLERWFSIEQRWHNYQEGVKLWRQAPIFGLGFNTLRYERQDLVSHAASGLDSSLLFVLATTGVVGLLAYLNLLKNLWEKNLLLKVSLVALITHSLFLNSLFYPWVMIWLWCVVDG